jgi:Apea-like HEPN
MQASWEGATLGEDRKILVAALESAVGAYRAQEPRPTLISRPDKSIIDGLSDAIKRCAAYNAVAGNYVYSGGSGPVLTADLMAPHLFQKGDGFGGDGNISDAVDWFLRLLTTREAAGIFKAAIWGFSIDEEVALSESSRLIPFAALPDSYMKTRVLERSKPCYDASVWLSHTYFDGPRVAFVREVQQFPYICSDARPFTKIIEMEQEVRDLSFFIEAASVGHPLALGCWFEYADQDLDFNNWQNSLVWLLPEIPPRIRTCTSINATTIRDHLRKRSALPDDLRSRVLRSMERFTLSQCRHQMIDRVLDLALAFEIAVSGEGRDQAPVGWRVGVRSAQLIGGPLEARQGNRDTLNGLYRLRNKATHGSSLSSADRDELDATVRRCSEIYQKLILGFLALGRKPEWSALELEARSQ